MNHACVFDLTYIEFLCFNQPYPQYGMIHPVELGCLFSRNHLWSLIYQIHGLIVIYCHLIHGEYINVIHHEGKQFEYVFIIY